MGKDKSANTLCDEDLALGMGASISRRDFLHDVALSSMALAVAGAVPTSHASAASQAPQPVDYPPVRTGMRGSHPGSYESAHVIGREGGSFAEPEDLAEQYDLVVVGAGISGLAAAHYYRERFGDDARILLLDNHDDFGGHAKRNEFHQGGRMVLSLGGTHNLEWWEFSDTVNAFMAQHGVDPQAMRERMDFDYGRNDKGSSAIWFDEQTYGVDRLITDFSLSQRLKPEQIAQIPISPAGRASLEAFYAADTHLFPERDPDALEGYLRSISYPEFLREYGGLTEDAAGLFDKEAHGSWGLEMRALSAVEAFESGFPGPHLLGQGWNGRGWDYPAAMWPDGNASLARLQVARLIPEVAPETTADNVAVARFDYSKLDREGQRVRLRLSSTVVDVQHNDGGHVAVSYIRDGKVSRIQSRHCVLACYHVIIPHLAKQLPEAQKAAMKYQVKHPLVLTNVLIRNTDALDKLGIDSLNCPGRLHQSMFTFRGLNNGGHEHAIDDTGPVSLVMWGMVSPPPEAVDVHSQLRASRGMMLGMSFEDYEREVRTVLKGLLGPAGFDVTRDVLAITVNRWPHGYAYEYLDLWDEDWAPGEAPNEIARRPFGAISIANSDAGASAYTHVAIDEAFRAVNELPA